MSKRRELQIKRQQRARQQVFIVIGAVVLVAVAFIAYSIYINTRPIGEITPVAKEEFPFVDGKALGKAEAPVTIQIFSDYQCPYCGIYAREQERLLVDTYVATGQVRLEYRHYVVVDGNVGGSESRMAAEASECAAEQGEFWNYHNFVFGNQNGEGNGAFSDRRLKAFADLMGLDTEAFNTCFDTRRYAQEVLTDERLARSLGVNSTPTMFVNGQVISNPLDFAEIQRAVESALGAQ